MTPGARVAAAIEILDSLGEGVPAEQALTRWARNNRFAGSKDRAAIRDHVFDVLRCRRTAEHFGKGATGRALMIGLLHQQGADLNALFDGKGHAPAPLNELETAYPEPPSDTGTRLNLPDWLLADFEVSLGNDADRTAHALQSRAPVTLRVNLAKSDRATVAGMLRDAGVETIPNPLSGAALTIIDGARKFRNSVVYTEGYADLQDAASQAVVASLPPGGTVLDYCAGGGGKALALAMDPTRQVFAHDIAPQRMADLPVRAARAGATVRQLAGETLSENAPFDVVLCDAPCSGSGAWRRAAEGKWTLTPERLVMLTQMQDEILDTAAPLVRQGGLLAYATCSVLQTENEARVEAFLARNSGWTLASSQRFAVDDNGDGFFTAHLTAA
ncbi:MAG: RsmB/NOP family class I SAM-dependent RNA methyltransferase [Sulfitobacter sp.]